MSQQLRLLASQLMRATHADGTFDAAEFLRLVCETYAEATEDRSRTGQAFTRMAEQLQEVRNQLDTTLQQLETTLEAVHHGVLMINPDGMVQVCNANAIELLGLPESLAGKQFSITEIADYLHELEIFTGENENTVEIEHDNGKFVEIHVRRLESGGAVILVEDITAERRRARSLEQAEAEYRSLFENSVYGIYRDTLEGKPVRANPALVSLNGYASEQEYVDALNERVGDWYVDPRRAEEFEETLHMTGRVKDFVSEVYRHRTHERVWITENAWYVRDPAGEPVFIEGTIQDATERIQATSEIERLANRDPLTGAANRFQFLKRLQSKISQANARCALYCIDLDHFKEVNDSLGHGAGDTVLQAVTDRLHEICGLNETVARLGGDEFALLLRAEDDVNRANATAARIVAAMNIPIMIDNHSISVGASVGVAIFPDHAGSAGELLRNADLALYHVKSTGRNGHYMFNYTLKDQLDRRKETERDLRASLSADELELHYQPIVESPGGRTASFEALMRWNHPARGFLLPGDFVPVAEESGLMAELGAWAIARACDQARGLPASIGVSVNISATQLRSSRVFSHVRQALETTGIDPARLQLEVTESAILANQSTAHQVLGQLRQLGVKLALDDFGTGYSSLSYLQTFAFNTVKIDRSFVAGMTDQKANLAIIRAVLAIGRDLGIDVVAEGVETEEQRMALEAEGCNLMQGFLFGKPKSFTDTASNLALEGLPDIPSKSNLMSKSA